MSAREEVERLLAEHYSPETCVRAGHFPRNAPMLAAHSAHVAQVLDEAGLLVHEPAAVGGYVCRHGHYATEHWCDDHADHRAEARP